MLFFLGRQGGSRQPSCSSLCLLPWGMGCSPGTHCPPLSPKTSPSTALTPWVESSCPILWDFVASLQLLAILTSTFQHRFCFWRSWHPTLDLKAKLETTLLIVLLQIYYWAILDITKVQNELGEVSVVIPDCFFFLFEMCYAGHFSDST